VGEYADRDMDADDLGDWPEDEPAGSQQTGASSEGAAPGQGARQGELASLIRPLADLADGDWLARDRWPARQWLLERRRYQGYTEVDRIGYLPAGVVGLFVSPGGTGKTAALVQLALAVATGRDWLGHYVARPGKVLLVLGEETADEIARRTHAAAQALELGEADRQLAYANLVTLPAYGANAAFLSPQTGGGLCESPNHIEISKYLTANGPWSLIALDPASRFMGIDDENDNAAATQFIRTLERLTQAPGSPTVLIAHHTSKGGIVNEHSQASARGASAFVDGARWMVSLEKMRGIREPGGDERNLVLLRLHKSNYGPPVSDVLFEVGNYGQPHLIPEEKRRALIAASEEFEAREEARKDAWRKAIKDEAKEEVAKERKAKGGATATATDDNGDPYE